MARKKIIAGNWKMNMTPSEAVALVETLKPLVVNDEVDVVFCVPAIDIIPAMEAAKGTNINIGAENMYYEEKGAYTGAEKQKKGRFEAADGGTIFFDEIGELSLNMQTRLLRVLQEKTFERVGGYETLTSDFRLIAATNRDLKIEVLANLFR